MSLSDSSRLRLCAFDDLGGDDSWLTPFDDDRLRSSHHLTPFSTPLMRPAVPIVFATGDAMFRSTYSTLDLNGPEYALPALYADTE